MYRPGVGGELITAIVVIVVIVDEAKEVIEIVEVVWSEAVVTETGARETDVVVKPGSAAARKVVPVELLITIN